MYKYKSFLLVRTGSSASSLNEDINNSLQAQLDDGWEYVDNIVQSVSVTADDYNKYGGIIIILRKSTSITL